MTLPDEVTLRESVMAEAERGAQRTLSEARARAQRLRTQAEDESDAECAALLDSAGATASRYRRQAVGSARLEAGALRARRREVVLERVFAQAGELLAGPTAIADDLYPSVVEALVRESVAQLGQLDALVIHADARALPALGGATLERIAEETGHRLSLGEQLPRGVGVVVASLDGRLRYDNTFEARMARLRDVLRVEVTQILAGWGA